LARHVQSHSLSHNTVQKKVLEAQSRKHRVEHIMNHRTIIAAVVTTAGTALAAPSFITTINIASPPNSADVATANLDADAALDFFDVFAHPSSFSAGCP
jgi:peptidoglycan/xylan/chitin deacetylase (PgdA/CDA1 family)